MNPHNPNPTEMILGTTHVREDLLRQEAHNGRVGRVARRVAHWVRTIARVAFVLLVLGILAAIVVGPGKTIDWVGSYLVPVVMVLGVSVGAFGILMWGVIKLHKWGYKIY